MSSLIKIYDADDKLLDPFVVEKFRRGTIDKSNISPFKGIDGVINDNNELELFFNVTTAYIH